MTTLLPPRYIPGPVDPYALDPDPPLADDGPIGLLFVNLGTPDAPTPVAIRKYLAEFLSDPRVIELPALPWQIILRAFILPRRPRALAPRYEEIWMEGGSPLLVWSQAQADGVGQALRDQGLAVHVALGMRYGNPSIASAINELQAAGCERILTVPMYPQYAASTTATAVDHVHRHTARLRNQPALRFIKRFHRDPGYIEVLAGQIRRYWADHGEPERLLLSFHGLPQRVVEQGDPYFRDCMETASLLRTALGTEGERVHVAFQSRFGAAKWLEPYTQPTLEEWARSGVRSVDVMCPGFVADCLETLEEIDMQCREAFLSNGGTQFRYLPCLNDDPAWVANFAAIVQRELAGW